MKERIITIVLSLIILAIALTIVLINYPIEKNSGVCTLDAKVCPDGSTVGRNPDNNCEFYECPDSLPIQNFCDPESRRTENCIEIYRPVCGYFNPDETQCIKEPCAQTFSNDCFACLNEDVLYWEDGECHG